MLATQFEEFEKGFLFLSYSSTSIFTVNAGPETRLLFHPLLGTGVFAADGQPLLFLLDLILIVQKASYGSMFLAWD